MPIEPADGYTSGCQITRRITESWGAQNLFCAACGSDSLKPVAPNTKAVDFRCPTCAAGYQLKSGKRWNDHRIPDSGYSAMMAAIASDSVPNLFVLQYTPSWRVNNLMLVPSFIFSASAVEKRKPLAPTARRAGWIGCNILLGALPNSGKLRIVRDGTITGAQTICAQYEYLRPLKSVVPTLRGWTLDVLKIAQGLSKEQFALQDVYAHDEELQRLHPKNQNVRPKIRQQLQVLRDMKLLSFLGNGMYKLRI